jgi:hypothetical protein
VLNQLPLAAESLNMDSQYFSFGSNMEDDTLANIEKFIRSSTSHIPGGAEKTAREVSSQITAQIQNHSISGTLIIVASCTHKYVQLFDPLVIDPGKAVQAWNTVHDDNRIDTALLRQAPGDTDKDTDKDASEAISVISGASYGSSFVGMVHILNSDTKKTGDFEKLKSGFEEKLRIGGWLSHIQGNFGVNEAALSDVKAFLSNQSVNCHISIVTMGVVPSFKSKELSLSVKSLAAVDDKTAGTILHPVQASVPSTAQRADESRQNAMLLNMQHARMAQVMKSLHKIDHEKNRVLDINSLMEAFENYISLVGNKGNVAGVPVNYFIKKLTKADIINLWTQKYHAGNTESDGEAKPKKSGKKS